MTSKARPKTKTDKGLEALSFETAFAELEGLVAQLEAGELPLEEALTLFERGQALAARCGQLLDQAELKVKQLTAEGGALEDFEPED